MDECLLGSLESLKTQDGYLYLSKEVCQGLAEPLPRFKLLVWACELIPYHYQKVSIYSLAVAGDVDH
jgi:hypothetical protein